MTDTSSPVLSITGNNGLDSLIRSSLIAASGAITGIILTWLNAHGFNDPNLNLMVSGATFAILVAGATALWGYLKGTNIGKVIASKEVVALQAGMAAMADHANSQAGAVVVTPPTSLTHKDAQVLINAYAPRPSPPGTTADVLNSKTLAALKKDVAHEI